MATNNYDGKEEGGEHYDALPPEGAAPHRLVENVVILLLIALSLLPLQLFTLLLLPPLA